MIETGQLDPIEAQSSLSWLDADTKKLADFEIVCQNDIELQSFMLGKCPKLQFVGCHIFAPHLWRKIHLNNAFLAERLLPDVRAKLRR
jgi:hypothetical protein